MVNSLRRFSKPIMLVITVIVIVSFSFWGGNMSRNSSRIVMLQLGGKDVTQDQWQGEVRKLQVYEHLQMPYAQFFSPERAWDIARSLVFEREVNALGVKATVEQQNEAFGQIQAFQDNTGQYSAEVFADKVRRVLMPLGYGEKQIDEFVEGQVWLQSVAGLVASAVEATPDQAKELVKKNQMTIEATYVELKQEDFVKDVKLTDEEVKKAYEDRKEQFKTLPQRRVKYAAFLLPPSPAGATKEEKTQRSAMLQEYGNKAYDLHEALTKPGANFEELTKSLGGIVKTTPFFDIQHPPAELEANESVAKAAFQLSKAEPYSGHLTMSDGLRNGAYVLMLDEEKAADQKPFEAVKAELETDLKNEKANAAMAAKAKELKTKIDETIKSGKSFYDALTALGQKPVALPIFGQTKRPPEGTKYSKEAYDASRELAPGQVSEPVQVADSTLLVYLDRRIAGDGKDISADDIKSMQERLTAELQYRALAAWIDGKTLEAGATPDKFRSLQ